MINEFILFILTNITFLFTVYLLLLAPWSRAVDPQIKVNIVCYLQRNQMYDVLNFYLLSPVIPMTGVCVWEKPTEGDGEQTLNSKTFPRPLCSIMLFSRYHFLFIDYNTLRCLCLMFYFNTSSENLHLYKYSFQILNSHLNMLHIWRKNNTIGTNTWNNGAAVDPALITKQDHVEWQSCNKQTCNTLGSNGTSRATKSCMIIFPWRYILKYVIQSVVPLLKMQRYGLWRQAYSRYACACTGVFKRNSKAFVMFLFYSISLSPKASHAQLKCQNVNTRPPHPNALCKDTSLTRPEDHLSLRNTPCHSLTRGSKGQVRSPIRRWRDRPSCFVGYKGDNKSIWVKKDKIHSGALCWGRVGGLLLFLVGQFYLIFPHPVPGGGYFWTPVSHLDKAFFFT